jgi:hypothetical protein
MRSVGVAVIAITLVVAVDGRTPSLSAPDGRDTNCIEAVTDSVIARLGEAFVRESMNLDAPLIDRRHPCKVCFLFQVPSQPWANAGVCAAIDSAGNLIDSFPFDGLPDCRANPAECDFPINEQTAIDIAIAHGLEEGVKPWIVQFAWGAGNGRTFVWYVQSMLHNRTLHSIVIDSNSGEVITDSRGFWR